MEGRRYPFDRSIFLFSETERRAKAAGVELVGTRERVLPSEMKLLGGESESRGSGRWFNDEQATWAPRDERIDMV